MKTLEDLYKEVQNNDALKEKFIAAAKENTLADFLKENGCDATVKDVMDFMRGAKERALNENELEKVAGGCSFTNYASCGCITTYDYIPC